LIRISLLFLRPATRVRIAGTSDFRDHPLPFFGLRGCQDFAKFRAFIIRQIDESANAQTKQKRDCQGQISNG
jgi:hypothetical protein